MKIFSCLVFLLLAGCAAHNRQPATAPQLDMSGQDYAAYFLKRIRHSEGAGGCAALALVSYRISDRGGLEDLSVEGLHDSASSQLRVLFAGTDGHWTPARRHGRAVRSGLLVQPVLFQAAGCDCLENPAQALRPLAEAAGNGSTVLGMWVVRGSGSVGSDPNSPFGK